MSTAESDRSPPLSPSASADGSAGALEGLVVVEHAEGIAGPVCGKLMAGFGAEVIKVEPPAGDVSRTLGPFRDDIPNPEASGLFLYLNAGKQSVVLDARQPIAPAPAAGVDRPGRRANSRPAGPRNGRAGVPVCPVRPARRGGRPNRPTARRRNCRGRTPASSWYRSPPFGCSGPYRDFAATNLVVHALSGELGLAGSRQFPPLKKGGNLADYHAGCHGFIGAVAALLARDRLGGQHVDVSRLESLTSILGATMNGWLYDERVSQRGDADPWSLGTAARRGEDGTHWEPSGVWKARDGYVLAYGRSSADWTSAIREMSEGPAGPRVAPLHDGGGPRRACRGADPAIRPLGSRAYQGGGVPAGPAVRSRLRLCRDGAGPAGFRRSCGTGASSSRCGTPVAGRVTMPGRAVQDVADAVRRAPRAAVGGARRHLPALFAASGWAAVTATRPAAACRCRGCG